MKNLDIMQRHKDDCAMFAGDKALFWAGRMSQTIESVMSCYPRDISNWLDLLCKIKHEYDDIIFSKLGRS